MTLWPIGRPALLVWAGLAGVGLAGAAPADCPAWDPQAERAAELIAGLQAETDARAARVLMDEMWRIWTNAPDARAQALLDKGMERREAYDYAAATEALDALVAYCPAYAEGYNQRAFVSFLRQDYDAALEDLERALAITPDHIAALSGQALTLIYMGRMEAGQAVLREALELNPWLPERGMLIERPGKDI